MDNKSLILNEIKGLKVKAITNKELDLFFKHLKLDKEEIKEAILELVKDGQLISSKNKLFLPRTIGFVRGKLVGNEKGFAFLKPDDEKEDYFIAAKNMGNAINGDIVLAKVYQNDPRMQHPGKKEARVEKVIKHGFEKIIGTFEKNGDACFVIPKDKRFNKDIYIRGNSSANAKVGQLVNVKITDFGNVGESFEGEIVEILGYPNDNGVDVLTVAREHNLFEEFPQEVLQEADSLPDAVNVAKYPKRKNFIAEKDLPPIITIDGEDTRDIDDAICLRKEGEDYRLWVHIADVSEYVTHESLLDKEAFLRGTSVYFPNFVIPMLPIKLSNGICSLHEGVERLALTCEMLVDKNGKLIESDVYESIIQSSHRMNYNEVQRMIDGDEAELKKYSDVAVMIEDMNELGKILYKMREKRGALDFDISEAYIKVDESGKTVDITKRPRRDSDKIIESFMICANEAVAEKFYNMDMPFVYRIHERPDEFRTKRFAEWCNGFGELFKTKGEPTNRDMQNFLNALKTKPYGTILNKLALRTMQKAKYSDFNAGHYGLGSECYCHFTSPIRRYPDLTVHRFIKWFLNDELYRKDIKELEAFAFESAENSSQTERNADDAEREVDDMKKAEYMNQFVGESYVGIVSGLTGFGIFVELDNTCEGRIDLDDLPGKWNYDEERQIVKGPKGSFRLGKKVQVKLVRASAEEKEIDFEFEKFIDIEKTNENHKKKNFDKQKQQNKWKKSYFLDCDE